MPVLRDLISRGLAHCVGADIDNHSFTPRRGEEVLATLVTWEKDKNPEGSWDDLDNASPKFDDIRRLVQTYDDSRHLDTAYRNGCQVFFTSDKGDIWTHREQLQELLSLRVMHSATEIGQLVQMCEAQISNSPLRAANTTAQ